MPNPYTKTTSLFNDSDVSLAVACGGCADLGRGCQALLPAAFGFCGGVRNALRMLQQVVDAGRNQRVWLLGEIIHNDTVNHFFEQSGVRMLPEGELEAVFRLADPSDCVVIPAFGVARELDGRLRGHFGPRGRIVDTTCPYVRRIWEFVQKMAADGRTVVIHGKPRHPETRATVSRARGEENGVILVPGVEEAGELAAAIRAGTLSSYPPRWVVQPEKASLDRLALVNQTTMLYSETDCIDQVLSDALGQTGGELVGCNTVCRATQRRQDAAWKLCRQRCDAVLVVGGYASSNTAQLYRLASQVAPTWFIRDASALTADSIVHYLPDEDRTQVTRGWMPDAAFRVGLLAGASCPYSDIGNVIRRLQELLTGVSRGGTVL